MIFFSSLYESHKKRIVGLDILRSIAILLVVYSHGIYLLPKSFTASYFKYDLGIDGVSIFFVLSGFLIGGILLKIIDSSEFSYKDLVNFWIRRWFRTIPNYLLVLLILVAYHNVFFKDFGSFTFQYLVFLQNFSSPHPAFFPEAWSLCVEEWFYVLFPMSIFILNKILKDKKKSIILSALFFAIFPLLLRMIKYNSGIGVADFEEEYRKIVLLRLDSLMYGIFASIIFYYSLNFWQKTKYISFVIGIALIIGIRFNLFEIATCYKPILFNFESISIMMLLPFFSGLTTTRLKYLDIFFISISLISYSMYLTNLCLTQDILINFTNIGSIFPNLQNIYWFNYTLYWVYTVAVSVLIYNLYESSMTKLRDSIKL